MAGGGIGLRDLPECAQMSQAAAKQVVCHVGCVQRACLGRQGTLTLPDIMMTLMTYLAAQDTLAAN